MLSLQRKTKELSEQPSYPILIKPQAAPQLETLEMDKIFAADIKHRWALAQEVYRNLAGIPASSKSL